MSRVWFITKQNLNYDKIYQFLCFLGICINEGDTDNINSRFSELFPENDSRNLRTLYNLGLADYGDDVQKNSNLNLTKLGEESLKSYNTFLKNSIKWAIPFKEPADKTPLDSRVQGLKIIFRFLFFYGKLTKDELEYAGIKATNYSEFVDLIMLYRQNPLDLKLHSESRIWNLLTNNSYYFNVIDNTLEIKTSCIPSRQEIIDGAPGTGKSYGVQKEISESNITHERVTFYSDYEYHNFIGSILPVLNKDKALEYKFVQGPFTKLLDEALSKPEEKHYIVIEELTRGNAAAIFGDIFQLLDRDNNGFSKYPISNDNIFNSLQPEVRKFLRSNYNSKIILPPNFSIICTINSSDQNVFPLDTAFKRRFDYKIESTKPNADFVDFKFNIGALIDISWKDFYTKLNEYILQTLKLKEDKQVGPYFIKKPKDNSYTAIQTKLAMYMWNDLHKVYTGSNKAIFTDVYTLADVSELFKTGTRKQILNILTEDFKKHFSLTEEPDEE